MTRYGDQVVWRSLNGGEYKRNMHGRAASQSELGSASATAASASATQVVAPVTPITAPAPAPAEILRMSLPAAAVEIPPEVPVSGAKQPPPLIKEIWKGYQTTKNSERLCFVLSLVFFERLSLSIELSYIYIAIWQRLG